MSLLLTGEAVGYVDWKDVNLLRRFMSDRAKIQARRVTGNSTQQQAEIAQRRSRTPARWRSCPTPAASPRPAVPSATASPRWPAAQRPARHPTSEPIGRPDDVAPRLSSATRASDDGLDEGTVGASEASVGSAEDES